MRMQVRLYRPSQTGQPRRTVATLTLTDRRDAACLVPSDLAPSARYFLRSVDSDDGDLTDRIVAVLRQASIRISRTTASSGRGVRARGDVFADEPYGTPAYWRTAVGRLESELPLEFDPHDWTEMVHLMDGATAPGPGAEDAASDEDDTSEVDGPDPAVDSTLSHASAVEPDAADWLRCLDPNDPVRAEQVFQQYRRDLTRFLEWQHDDPESAAQEALVRGLRRIARGADTSKAGVRGFLFGFARNVAKEGWKIRARERPLDDATAARRPSTSREHAQVEAKLRLRNVLGQLTPEDRRIILRYCEETDHAAHCRELGVTPGNLRVIVHRIRVEIRQREKAGPPALAK